MTVPFGEDYLMKITDCHWGTDSILFVRVGFNFSSDSSAPALPTIQLTGMSFAPGIIFDVMGSVNHLKENASAVPVVNPVTAKMLAAYDQWTPQPVSSKRAHTHTGPTTEKIWYVDGSNFPTGLGGGEGFVSPVPTPDNYLNPTYFTGVSFPLTLTDVPPGTGPTGVDVIAARQPSRSGYVGGGGVNLENVYLTEAAAQAAADFLNAIATPPELAQQPASVGGPLTITGGGTPHDLFTLDGAAVFAVNIGSLKASEGKYTFEVRATFASGGSLGASVGVSAQAYKKLRNFTLNNPKPPYLEPSFSPWSGNELVVGSSSTITGTIDAKTLNVTLTG